MIPKRLMILISMLLALVIPAFTQTNTNNYGGVGGGSGGSGAPDDSYWSDGAGGTTHLDVTENPQGGVWTTATSAGGFTNAANGTAGPDTPSGLDTCRNSDTMTNASNEQYRVKDGKLQKKINGRWKTLKKVPKPKNKNSTSQHSFGTQYLTAGTPAPFAGTLHGASVTVDLQTGDAAPFDGWLTPGDEVVSLPLVVGSQPTFAPVADIGSTPITGSPGDDVTGLPLVRH